ncbi:MAG: cytochrome c oxidase assembly protein [Comamonadaceae bacterium]|nr:MAG: cytochrome c oxidase assembly protein [Comamonadaceae bacterium]
MFQELITLCTAAAALALPQDWWLAWSFAPVVVVPLAALLCVGWRAGKPPGTSFVTGWTLLAIALVSPLCRMAATLVSAHMVQLMVLAVAAPVFLSSGGIGLRLRDAWPTLKTSWPEGRSDIGTAAALYALVLWIWHVPAVYELTLTSTTAHVTAYAWLVTVSIWFWQEVLHAPVAARGRVIGVLAATLAHTGFLGAILTFTPGVLYPVQSAGAAAWQLSALDDQQLAGLIMWVPGGLAYLAALVALSLKWWALAATSASGKPA